jgi:hypothetical protein
VADLHGNSARWIVLDGVAVVCDGVGSEVVAGIKGQPLVLAPGGEVEADLGAQGPAVAVCGGQAFGPVGSAVRNSFECSNSVRPTVT